MQRAAPFVLRIAAASGTTVRPFPTAAEAYDEASAVRRALPGAGSLLQVEDVTSGAVLGQWRHNGTGWFLEDSDARSPSAQPVEVASAG